MASIMISKPVEEFSRQTWNEGTGKEENHDIRDPIEVATTLAFLIGLLQVHYDGADLRVYFLYNSVNNLTWISIDASIAQFKLRISRLGCMWTAKTWLLSGHYV